MLDRVYVCRKYTWMLPVHILAYASLSCLTAGIEIGGGSFRPAVALLSVAAALYGPAWGFIAGFAGNAVADWWSGEMWWHWSAANGILGMAAGFLRRVPGFRPHQGELWPVHLFVFVLACAVGNYTGLTLAALLDVVWFGVSAAEALPRWVILPATANLLSAAVLGVPILFAYARWRRHLAIRAESGAAA